MKKDVKILIIGDDEGPKAQFMKNCFDFELTVTAGPSFQQTSFQSGETRFNIWSIEYKDIEKNFATVPMYFKDAEQIVVIAKEQSERDNIVQRLKSIHANGKQSVLEPKDFDHFFNTMTAKKTTRISTNSK